MLSAIPVTHSVLCRAATWTSSAAKTRKTRASSCRRTACCALRAWTRGCPAVARGRHAVRVPPQRLLPPPQYLLQPDAPVARNPKGQLGRPEAGEPVVFALLEQHACP